MTSKKKKAVDALADLFTTLSGGAWGFKKPVLTPNMSKDYLEIAYEQETFNKTLEMLTDNDLLTILDQVHDSLNLGPRYYNISKSYIGNDLNDEDRHFLESTYKLVYSEFGYYN